MSNPRHVRTSALGLPHGRSFGPRQHALAPPGWDQLIHVGSGVLRLRAVGLRGAESFVVPAGAGLWLPEGNALGFETLGFVALRALYFQARSVRTLPRRATLVAVSPLVRELVEHLLGIGVVNEREHRSAITLLKSLLSGEHARPLALPEPSGELARTFATTAIAHPERSTAALAAECGASVRTIERAFAAETGMPLGQWRTRARIQEALRRLGEGQPVGRVSAAVGYAGVSAFVAAFRRLVGQTPGRFVRG